MDLSLCFQVRMVVDQLDIVLFIGALASLLVALLMNIMQYSMSLQRIWSC